MYLLCFFFASVHVSHGFLSSSLRSGHASFIQPTLASINNIMMANNPFDGFLETSPNDDDTLFKTLISRFQGDFDNYNQVVQDRRMGLTPREGGGHEHFHVTLIPFPIHVLPDELFKSEKRSECCAAAVVAAYYFDGMPNRIFRLRMYTLQNDETQSTQGINGPKVQMRLYSFYPDLEKILRKGSENILDEWTNLISNHIVHSKVESFKELDRCDIEWSKTPDETRHSYLHQYSSTLSVDNKSAPIHAKMIHDHEKGGVLIESQMIPGTYIRIQDELSLWQDHLWINDRGYDADTKKMVYGNTKGVPYQMERVATLTEDTGLSGRFKRAIVCPDLQWTLGEKWRTPQEYETKMAAVGGVTANMNMPKNN